ncbi:BRO family protein [Desulfomicrobium sp. ZS1]|uniref:BRO family protein n=1 Tax=Desulfomicrobium sp. ZS1 TaxID=2952228 RepID=UPI0035305E36
MPKIEGELWFVAKDVCDVLDITNVTQAIKSLGPSGNSVGSVFKLTSGTDRAHRRKNRSPS